jgi:YYY domain-containing protein
MGPIFLWWLVLAGLGLVALPLTFRLFSARSNHGCAFARVVALLAVTYVAWVLGCLGIPYSTALTVAVVAFVALNLALAWVQRDALIDWLRGPGLRQLLVNEALWTAGFLFFAWQRSLQPQIVDQEKFMDFSFFNTLLRTESMPPQDPWMSGMTFNYYYFGYLIFANLARCFALPSFISYNLCVATIAGLAFAELCSIGLTLTRRLWLGVLTGAFGIVLGNVDGFLQLLEKGGFTQFDYFRSTRIVGHDATINEFPYFTAIHGDLHPHFLVMPFTILLLGLLLDPERLRGFAERGVKTFRDLLSAAAIAFVLGTMVAISTWELPVGAMTTFLLLHRYLPLRPLFTKQRIQLVVGVGALLVAGYVFFLPFYLSFDAPQGGVGVKFASTSLAEFLTVFGGLLAIPALFLAASSGPKLSLKPEHRQLLGATLALTIVIAYLAGNAVFPLMLAFVVAALVAAYATDDAEQRAPILLILAASATLLACELVYIKDPYGEKLYRMNTVFKLYLQSWLLLAVAGPWCLAQFLEAGWVTATMRRVALIAGGAAVLASCAYPLGVTATRLHSRMLPATLDGNEYLQREHPDEFAAIQWIRQNVRGLPVILEASGNPYSYYARFSSNTGLPTVMGWANHEGLWRSHEEAVGKRQQEVTFMYNAAALADVQSLLDRYMVKYVVVGEVERKDYKTAGLQKFEQLKAVFSQGGTTIYER